MTPGAKFKKTLAENNPLQIVGTINAFAALMAEYVGFSAIYLSGAGVANACYGLPDLGVTNLDDVLQEAAKITSVTKLPLLVDIDTGFGNALMIQRTIKSMERAQVAAIHIEDQPVEKRCGHRQNKVIISIDEMVDRLKACLDARSDPDFVIMARCDAYSVEGLDATIKRCLAYEEAGADAHFLEAVTTLKEYTAFSKVLKKPILANITEFGQTPLFSKDELKIAGVDMILYPLSAWRAMNLAALKVFQEIKTKGTQTHLLDQMQTREELYGFLDYEKFEKIIDQQNLKKGKS